MAKAEQVSAVAMPTTFTDVLYFTNQDQMPADLKHLLKQRKLSFSIQPADQFPYIHNQLDLIGTVIIDMGSLDASQHEELDEIIESLELKNIGVILLGNSEVGSVKNFALVNLPVKDFVLTNTIESISIEELWAEISINLMHRKNTLANAVKRTVPVENVRDYEKNPQLDTLQALTDNFTEQLRMAGQVQRDFLPSQLPNCKEVEWATIFLPAEWVSGDIYDIVRIDEQHIGFYVADVVGHGMPAALLTIFLKQALVMRETVEDNYRIFQPSEVLKNLNMRMTTQKLSGYQFATCCYCLLNIDTLQLTYARAGHPYPVLLRPRQEPQKLQTRGALLGIFDHDEYSQQTIQLKSGDKLLLYSDGADPVIGDFNDSAGLNFTEEFCKIKDLPIVEMTEKLNILLQDQKNTSSQIDDITTVGLEIL